jgi:hypothetical protein
MTEFLDSGLKTINKNMEKNIREYEEGNNEYFGTIKFVDKQTSNIETKAVL